MKYKVTYKDGSSKIVDALNVQYVQNMFTKHAQLFEDFAKQIRKNPAEDNVKFVVQDAINAEMSMLSVLQKM